MKKIALSGIKPTGELHIGNYLGMIKPTFDLAKEYRALYFIADYHALTSVRNRKTLNYLVYDVAASLLALELDTEKIIFIYIARAVWHTAQSNRSYSKYWKINLGRIVTCTQI